MSGDSDDEETRAIHYPDKPFFYKSLFGGASQSCYESRALRPDYRSRMTDLTLLEAFGLTDRQHRAVQRRDR
jgi:hypothetical protein